MIRAPHLVLTGVFLVGSMVRGQEPFTDQQLAFFEKKVRPVLVEHCYACHSADARKLKGGLRLDDRQALLRGGDSGPAITPGKPAESLLIEAVRYESLEMPPSGKLADQVIADLAQWIEMGAPDPRTGRSAPDALLTINKGRNHWAFQPVADPSRPEVRDRAWPLAEVDYFLLRQLEDHGLQPAVDADRYGWLRRASLDLTGVPPTVAETQRFVQDQSPRACEAVVDRLLASPAFGQRWARHWLDLVGYADQIGTSNSVFAEHAWRYRDYVIDAYNKDKPFDRFLREQIAGDLMKFETIPEQAAGLTATGFLLLGDLEIVEADKAKLRVDVIDQQIDKTGKAFLAMTLACARCHDHKFDPVSQSEYYALGGFFYNTAAVFKTSRGVWSDVQARELPETPTEQAAREQRLSAHAARLQALKGERDQAAQRQSQLDQQLEAASTAADEAARMELIKERTLLAGRIGQLDREIEHAEFFAPAPPRAFAVSDRERIENMHITIRGNPHALGEETPRGFLAAATSHPPVIPTTASGREQLADWLASPDNPLTARVAVNRVWQKLFGEGLVRTVDYFGLRGEAPSHPELLDRLATDLIRSGWSIKQLVRQLVLSRGYRMSSDHNPAAYAIDPDNRLLWRMNRQRLDAEALRDALLSVSGQLQSSAGGPALPLEYPENVGGINPSNVNPPSFQLAKWRPDQANLRTIYLPVIRSGAQPGPAELRNVFDFVQPAMFAGQRPVTAVPTQALFLLNSPVLKQHAADVARRIDRVVRRPRERLEFLWMCVLNRPPAPDEISDAEAFLAEAGEAGWRELSHALLISNEFLMRL